MKKYLAVSLYCIVALNAMDSPSNKDKKLEKVLSKKVFSAAAQIAAKFKEDHKNCTDHLCFCKFKSSSATKTNE